MRLVFMGTPDFAVPTLAALWEAGHMIECCYTQPDRPRGRGQKPCHSPVKRFCLAHAIPVRQPEKLDTDEEYQYLVNLAPQAIIVVAYGQKVPPRILSLPEYGCINVHASLLPRWRGAAPIQRAIMTGDEVTGITIMQMDEGWDTGPILLQAKTKIEPRETAGELHDRLAELGADLLIKALAALEDDGLVPRPQPAEGVTLAPRVEKAEGCMDWQRSAAEIDRLVRALNPVPGAYTYHQGRLLKIWQVEPLDGLANEQLPGRVVGIFEGGIVVATGRGSLVLSEVQPAGRSRMTGQDYANGYGIAEGDVLGE